MNLDLIQGGLLITATGILTGIVKLIPWFSTTERKKWLAFVVALVLVAYNVYQNGSFTAEGVIEGIGLFGVVLAGAYGLYHAIGKKIGGWVSEVLPY